MRYFSSSPVWNSLPPSQSTIVMDRVLMQFENFPLSNDSLESKNVTLYQYCSFIVSLKVERVNIYEIVWYILIDFYQTWWYDICNSIYKIQKDKTYDKQCIAPPSGNHDGRPGRLWF